MARHFKQTMIEGYVKLNGNIGKIIASDYSNILVGFEGGSKWTTTGAVEFVQPQSPLL